jgi:hypothetical protein
MVGDAVESVEDHGVGIRVALRDNSLFQTSAKMSKRSTWNICGYQDVRTTYELESSLHSDGVSKQCLALSSQFTAQTRTLSQISSAASKKAERGGAVAGF